MGKILICLDDGHGMSTAGKRTPTLPNGQKSETGSFMHENEFNRAVVKYLKLELEFNGFSTLLVAPTDADVSLKERTDLANAKGANLYVSVHANANTSQWGSWGGIETFVYPSGESKRIGTIIHKYVMQGTKLRDRGVKDGSGLHVIRETNMPAVLIECGFMDSTTDYKYLLSDAYRKETAQEIAKGVCEAYGVKYKSYSEKSAYIPATLNGETIKAVDVGGYVGLHWKALDALGVNNYSYKFSSDGKSVVFTINGKATSNTRVYEGHSYIKYSEIHPKIDVKKNEKGVFNFFIREEERKTQPIVEPTALKDTPCVDNTHNNIAEKSVLTKEQMVNFQEKCLPDAPKGIAELYYDLGVSEGIRGDVAFCQAIKETGRFKYGGSVKPEQNNFCGLGATGGGVAGNSFPDVKTGVLAHIQHLKAYGSEGKLVNECVDPRYNFVSPKGKAKHVEELGGKWAVPGFDKQKYQTLEDANKAKDSYGYDIVKMIDVIKSLPIEPKQEDEFVDITKPNEFVTKEELNVVIDKLIKYIESNK